MARVLVLYYSTYGHVERMAEAVAEGARGAGAEVTLKRVAELAPREVLEKAGAGVLLGKHASVRRIRAAVSVVLDDPGYREAAGRIGDSIRQSDGAEVAADAISQFTKTYVPH